MVANRVLPPDAAADDPRISVHTLGESLYCPRAGLQAYENQGQADDEPPVVAHLSFLPPYELAELQEQIHWLRQYVLSLLGASVVFVVVGALAATFVSPWSLMATLVVLWLVLTPLLKSGQRLFVLQRLLQQALATRRQALEDSLDASEPIDWWGLLNAGFDSVQYDKLFDPRSQLGGRPWRVLRRGGLRIPVIRLKDTKEQLFDSHFAKVAAHCHLLQQAELATLSPYGIVLFGDTYRGFAIPNDPRSRDVFHRALVQTREMVRSAAQPDREPPAPNAELRSRLCAGCPWGFPVSYRPGASEFTKLGALLPARTRPGHDGRHYHSACGDRFGWTPPHERAKEKGLSVG